MKIRTDEGDCKTDQGAHAEAHYVGKDIDPGTGITAPRPEPSEQVKAKIEAAKSIRKEVHAASAGLRGDLKDASGEERKQLIAAFKEANKDKLEELKAKEKEVREAIRSQKDTGDRRSSR